MARLGFVVAALAMAAVASGKTASKTVRADCVDAYNQVKPEGSKWVEGVNGCLALTCTNGQAIGVDSCHCVWSDGSQGKTGDIWYSIPTCTSCNCNYGASNCTTIPNCLMPTTTVTATATGSSSSPTASSCPGPDGLVMHPGDLYIDGCQNCTCNTNGAISCVGVVECPVVPTATAASDGCFLGSLTFVDANVDDQMVDDGYIYTDLCNECVCQQGVFFCKNTGSCDSTTAAAPTATTTDNTDDNDASLDCDVGVGIVLNGDNYDQDCGGTCTCVNGEMQCPACPSNTSSNATTPTNTPSAYICIGTDGSQVPNGGSYQPAKCNNCTCVNGVFTCVKTCERDCKASDGTVVQDGHTYNSPCQCCTCDDATLTCNNTCEGKVCTIPNSKTTIQPGKSKSIDSCTSCKCTSTVLLQCRNKCETETDCICNGKSLKSGNSSTDGCQKCTCNGGSLSCKKVC